jgi:hypothetical protein
MNHLGVRICVYEDVLVEQILGLTGLRPLVEKTIRMNV